MPNFGLLVISICIILWIKEIHILIWNEAGLEDAIFQDLGFISDAVHEDFLFYRNF